MLSYVKKRKSIKRKSNKRRSNKRKSHSRKSNKRKSNKKRSNKRKSRDGRTPLKLSRYSKKKLGKMKSVQKMGEYFDRAEKRFYKKHKSSKKKSRSRVKRRKSKSLFKVTKSDLKLRSKKLSNKGKAEIIFEYTLSHKIPKSLKTPKLSKGWKVVGRGTHLKARSYNRDIFLEGPKSSLKQVKSKLKKWSRKIKVQSRIR